MVDTLNIQCSALRCLSDYMINFGTDLQPDFSSIKFYLRHWYGEDKEFIANFLSSTTLSLLRASMYQLKRLRLKVGKIAKIRTNQLGLYFLHRAFIY